MRRRAPLRRRGTFRRRYRRYRRAPARRRSRPDRYVLRAKYSYTHTVTDKSGQSVQFKPAASNFTEFNEIYKNFEGFRFKRLTCTIRPLFNVDTPDNPALLSMTSTDGSPLTQSADLPIFTRSPLKGKVDSAISWRTP